jgi:tetratricopeptide (TPR) repeat protein
MGKYFKKERKIKPSSINKFYSLGIYYFKNEEYKKAIEFFKKVLIIEPDHADSKNKMRLLIKKLKNKENYLSEKYYSIVDGYLIDKKIAVIGENINFKTWFNLGLYYKKALLYDKAICAFKNVLKIRPNHVDTHFELTNIYGEIENYYEYSNEYYGIDLFNIGYQINNENYKEIYSGEMISKKLNMAELHYKLSWAFGELKYYPQVIELCKRAINIEPKFVDAYYWLGWIYEKLKQYKGAVFAYIKAIYIDKNYIFAYNRLGNIYLKQSKFGEAIELYKESIKNNPGNIQAYLKVGFIYNKILQYDKAIEILKKALEIDPQNFFLWHLISKSYRNLGWYGNTKDALKNAIDIKPDYFKAYKTLREVFNNLAVKNGRPLMDVEIINTTKKTGDYLAKKGIDFTKRITHLPKSRLEDKAIFQLYKEYGTLEKVGRKVGLTRERIRQILEKGNRYGLFEYPIKKDLISYPFLINYFTNKEELLNELSICLKKDEMLLALSTDIVNFNRLLSHFNLNIKDIQVYSKKKTLKMQYDEYVKKIGYHPRTTEMREDKEARNIWVKITRYWGSMANFRQEFGYPFIKQGNPKFKENIREWQQQRSALIILRKKSYMEIILKNLSERGPLNKKYLARECDISEQDCLNILNSMIKKGEIVQINYGAKTIYMIKKGVDKS